MKALIFGITGMDGWYLAKLLLSKGYTVIGTVRQRTNKKQIPRGANSTEINIANQQEIDTLISTHLPDEIYNLAAVSNYQTYTENPIEAHTINGLVPVMILKTVLHHHPKAKFFQAGTCQVFGNPTQVPQDETTRFNPPNPYAISKAYAHHMVEYYRREHKLYAVNGILYSHESPRRTPQFVTRKITQGVARISLGKEKKLNLGDVSAQRDWGYAGDFVNAFWLTLQQKESTDYVIGTGESHTVLDFCKTAFEVAGITKWETLLHTDSKMKRTGDANRLQANPRKIQSIGWEPTVGFLEIVKMMVNHDIQVETELKKSRDRSD